MKRISIVIIVLSTIFFGCNHDKKLANEIHNIASSVLIHTTDPSDDLIKLNVIIPARYHEMATLFSDLSNENEKLNKLLDSLISENKRLSSIQKKRFNRFYELIDSIYIPRLDTTRTEDGYGNNYQYTQLTLLNEFLTPLKEKVLHASSKSDMELTRLYLNLIVREVVDFIHMEAQEGTTTINYIKPVTIKKGNTFECYLAAVDTFNPPYILIGKFKSRQIRDQYFYGRPIEVIDSISFFKEKAVIDLNKIIDNEAVIYFRDRYGDYAFKIDK